MFLVLLYMYYISNYYKKVYSFFLIIKDFHMRIGKSFLIRWSPLVFRSMEPTFKYKGGSIVERFGVIASYYRVFDCFNM